MMVRSIPRKVRSGLRRFAQGAVGGLERIEGLITRTGDPDAIPIVAFTTGRTTPVDSYWGEHTVRSAPFQTARASLRYLRLRAREYPLFERLMELYGDHRSDTVVDYGCGPGNDLVGFLVVGRAHRVIGIDVSRKALELARQRLALHRIGGERVTLIQVADGAPAIPLDDASVDLIYCEGVLHHASDPDGILREFRRILRPGAKATLMVYNRDSLWYHLYTAYRRQVLDGDFAGLTIDEAFQRNTDGEEVPISRAYAPDDFVAECEAAGFRTLSVGGYFATLELELFASLADQAMEDGRLAEEHRQFLRELQLSSDGLPQYRGRYAGIGGVYHLVAPPAG
jgi:ubiquinone/menaquinone biosynthesis C-methylase UbiE